MYLYAAISCKGNNGIAKYSMLSCIKSIEDHAAEGNEIFELMSKTLGPE